MAESPTVEPKPWTSENDVVKKIPIRIQNSSWMELLVAKRKDTGQQYLRLRKFRQNFNIKTPEQLANIMETLHAGSEILGWEEGRETHYQEYLDQIAKLKQARSK
ncbi:MAG: hypothetical protein ACREBU_22030, partial [Nitrososphaera sp.]